ncbi:MAG TPA: hypothetical protein VNR62_01895, partial [Cellulomonas sp.]|nr:hypothetical protein [Cellulomonas sp.]
MTATPPSAAPRGRRGRGRGGPARRGREQTREADEQRRAARRARDAERRTAVVVPPLQFPEQLPVSARRDEIAAAIRDHQVVVVAGET